MYGTNFEWPQASPEGVKLMDDLNNSPLGTYGAISVTIYYRGVKSKRNGAQKRVSGKKKTCTRFPCERLKAMPEGRDSPLTVYEAISAMINNRGVKK